MSSGPISPDRDRPDLDQAILGRIDAAALSQASKNFCKVELDLLEPEATAPADILLPVLNPARNQVTMQPWFPAGTRISSRELAKLRHNRLCTLYVRRDQADAIIACQNQRAAEVLGDHLAPPRKKVGLVYTHARHIVEQSFQDPRLGQNVCLARQFLGNVAEFLANQPGCVGYLGEVLSKDYTTYTHSVNVALLAVSFAVYLKLPLEQITILGAGALFHDIGKQKIPLEILTKPGKLNPDEWQVMRKHPTQGYNMLRANSDLPPDALRMVYHHHEDLDGNGYPNALAGDAIGFGGKMLRIIDTYDALTSNRCYSGARAGFEAVRLIQTEMQTRISQSLFKDFLRFLGNLGDLSHPGPGRPEPGHPGAARR